MQTPIAASFQHQHKWGRCALFSLVATLALASDLTVLSREDIDPLTNRAAIAAGALALFVCLAPTPRRDLGLRLIPVQGVRYWLKVGGILLAIVRASAIAAGAVLLAGHFWREPPRVAPENVTRAFIDMCLIYPVLEELLYRLMLCVPIAALSPRAAIVVSGATFAWLHVAYGNPGPDNFVAGYFLAWAYLKSGTIVVPILLHAGGNAIALGFQVFAWRVIYC